MHTEKLCKSRTLLAMDETESPRRKRRRQRLELLLKEFGGAAQVARESGTPKSHFSAMVSSTRGLGDALAAKLEGLYNKPEGWFDLPFDNSESGTPTDISTHGLTPAPQPNERAIQVPLLANSGSLDVDSDVQHEDVLIGHIALSPEWVAKRIKPTRIDALRFTHAYGDSMSPTLEDGDILLVDTGRISPSGADGVYVLEASHRVFIKRVTERLGGGYDVTSDNPRVKTVDDLDGSREIGVRGRVVWVWNGRKL